MSNMVPLSSTVTTKPTIQQIAGHPAAAVDLLEHTQPALSLIVAKETGRATALDRAVMTTLGIAIRQAQGAAGAARAFELLSTAGNTTSALPTDSSTESSTESSTKSFTMDAMGALESIGASYVEDVTLALQTGVAAHLSGNMTAAAMYYRQVLKVDPEHAHPSSVSALKLLAAALEQKRTTGGSGVVHDVAKLEETVHGG